MAKIKRVGTIPEFMAGKRGTWLEGRQEAIERFTRSSIIGTGVAGAMLLPASVFAATPEAITAGVMTDGVKNMILNAFDPLIDLIVTLSYPIAGIMIAGGCLMIMIGSRDKGVDMLRNAAIGYILVQLSPMLLKILVGIGTGVGV